MTLFRSRGTPTDCMAGFQIREAADDGALPDLSPAWEDLASSPNPPPPYMHPDHLRLWLNRLAPDAEVRVITAWSGETCVGYAPFMVVPDKLGRFRGTSLRFIGNNVGLPGDLSYLDVWTRTPDPRITRALLSRGRIGSRARAWDFGFLPAPSAGADGPPGRSAKERLAGESKPFVSLALPETWDAYLARLSAGTRQQSRKYYRHLERLGKLEVRIYREGEDCALLVRAMIANHERWWTGTPREGWYGGPDVKDFFIAAARRLGTRGEFIATTLELDRRPIAWHVGAAAHQVHYAELISSDWSLAEYSPGSVLSFAMIPKLIELGIRRVHLGPGLDQRKRALGGVASPYVRVRGYRGLWRFAERAHAHIRGVRSSPEVATVQGAGAGPA